MQIEVVGVYQVEAPDEPCHIVEMIIDGTGALDLAMVTQEAPGEPRSNWQVPYDEHLLDATGQTGAPFEPGTIQLSGATRLAFFFHYLELDRSLETPVGPVRLPAVSPRPKRLDFMRYDPP